MCRQPASIWAPLPWRSGETANQGLVAGLEGSDYRALWDPQGYAVHLFDRRRGIAIYAVRSRNDFRSWERSLPLRQHPALVDCGPRAAS